MIGREAFPPCGGVWCGECYRESESDLYTRMQGAKLELDDIESDLLQEGNDLERYRSTRNGDHLMKVPFGCDLCHFRNITSETLFLEAKRTRIPSS